MADGMLRSPTFLVGAERQRKNLDEFKRREQQLAEAYHKNKPLCFNGSLGGFNDLGCFFSTAFFLSFLLKLVLFLLDLSVLVGMNPELTD